MIVGFQNSILDTVFWALGGVFALSAFLAGFGWWTNNKLFEGEKSRLKQEMETRVAAAEARFSNSLENTRAEFDRTVDAKTELSLTRMLSEAAEIRGLIAALQQNLDGKLERIEKDVNSLRLDFETSNVRNTLAIAELRAAEAYTWGVRNVPGNELISHAQALDAALRIDSEPFIKASLDDIRNVITEKILPSGRPILPSSCDLVKTALLKVKGELKLQSGEVLQLLEKIPLSKPKA